MIGLERDVVPLIGRDIFLLGSQTVVVAFIVTFGVTKALAKLYADRTADRTVRKPLLVAGWLVAVPIPFLLMWHLRGHGSSLQTFFSVSI